MQSIMPKPAKALVVLFCAFVSLSSATPMPLAAQEAEVINEDSSLEFVLAPNEDGIPVQWSADVIASADLQQFVVDVYIDGVLRTSELEPNAVSVDLEPVAESRVVRIDVRQHGNALTCEHDSGAVQLQNIVVERVVDRTEPATLLDEPQWMVTADSPAEVANLAAIGTYGSAASSFSIVQSGGAMVEVGADAEFATAEALWIDLTGGADGADGTDTSRLLPADGQRFVVTETAELTASGGSVFISESAFGGRVGSVRLVVDLLFTPISLENPSFAIRVDDEVVETGLVDFSGQDSFEVTVEEASWPRDANVAIELSHSAMAGPCDNDRAFSGQMTVTAVPLGTPASELTVGDFPAVLLEGDASIFAADGVSDYEVASVASALQATSDVRLTFTNAATADAAAIIVTQGSDGSIVSSGDQLVVTLNDETVDVLQAERFWVFDDDAVVNQAAVEIVPDAVAFVDVDEGPLANAVGALTPVRTISFALLALGVLAVLRMLWKNSKAPSAS